MRDALALLARIERIKKENPIDLSSDEDLAVGVMNLISIEEHLYFTVEKTGQTKYLDLLNEVRKLRIEAFRRLVKNPEGEGWCIGKHLLAASMRFMEVGTKNLKEGKKQEAMGFFDQAFELFSMFWRIRSEGESARRGTEDSLRQPKIKGTLDWVKKQLDCCKE